MMTPSSFVGPALNAIGLVSYGLTQISGKTARILVGFPPGGTSDDCKTARRHDKEYASSIMVE